MRARRVLYENEIDSLLDLHKEDAEPIVIHTKEPNSSYTVQRVFLKCVSSKLADYCNEKHNNLPVDDTVFRIFLAWLLCRKIGSLTYLESDEQQILAEAWNFGMQYEISEFQDAVMHELVDQISDEQVSPDAVSEAYKGERYNVLQRALVAQLAIDMRTQAGNEWDRDYFTWQNLKEADGFLQDLIEAMAKVEYVAGSAVPKIQVKDFLVTPDIAPWPSMD